MRHSYCFQIKSLESGDFVLSACFNQDYTDDEDPALHHLNGETTNEADGPDNHGDGATHHGDGATHHGDGATHHGDKTHDEPLKVREVTKFED